MTQVHQQSPAPNLTPLLGTWRRFGIVGPVYQVVSFDHQLEDGDWMMRVRVLETGEVVDYRLTHLLEDPKEA